MQLISSQNPSSHPLFACKRRMWINWKSRTRAICSLIRISRWICGTMGDVTSGTQTGDCDTEYQIRLSPRPYRATRGASESRQRRHPTALIVKSSSLLSLLIFTWYLVVLYVLVQQYSTLHNSVTNYLPSAKVKLVQMACGENLESQRLTTLFTDCECFFPKLVERDPCLPGPVL